MLEIPFGLEPGALALLALGLLVASYARGYSGFGFSALLVASGSIVTDPANVVPLAISLEVVASIVMAVSVWRSVAWKQVGLLVAGAFIGNPAGVALLLFLAADTLRLGISAFIFCASLVLLSGWHLTRPVGAPATFVVGIGSGVANGATALGGLPLALFMTVNRQDPAQVRASLIAYFFVTDAYAGTLMATQGILNAQTLVAIAWAVPILFGGIWLGSRSFAAATPEGFRRVVLGLLIVLSLLGAAKAFGVI